MSPPGRRTTTFKKSTQAAQIGMTALQRRMKAAAATTEEVDAVQPFPHRLAERSHDIAIRLRFLLNRLHRGETRWGKLAITEAIAECEAELEQAKEQERLRDR